MAELTTWSVKMTDGLKEKIAGSLQESGLTGKEFMEVLLNTYEQVKKDRPEITPDLDELETLTKRICAIYVNVGERITTLLNDKDNSYKTLVTEKTDLARTLQKRITELENALKEKITIAKELAAEKDKIQEEKINLDLRQQREIQQLAEINQSNKSLIEEYRQKNDTLTGLLAEYETYKNQIQELKKEVNLEKIKRAGAEDKFKKAEDALNKNKEKLFQTEERYKVQIESIIEQQSFEKEKALLEQEKSLRNELQAEREEYNNRIKALLDEIEARNKALNKPKNKDN
jgi:chromosome segregation ATPase